MTYDPSPHVCLINIVLRFPRGSSFSSPGMTRPVSLSSPCQWTPASPTTFGVMRGMSASPTTLGVMRWMPARRPPCARGCYSRGGGGGGGDLQRDEQHNFEGSAANIVHCSALQFGDEATSQIAQARLLI